MSSAMLHANSIISDFDPNIFNLCLLNGPTDTHLRAINKLLSTSKTSRKGLEVLNSILNYCTVDSISDYVILWLNFCLKESNENFTEIKLLIISKLIEISYTNHDVSKKIVSDCLLKVVEFCLKQNSNYHEVLAALEVLTVSMKRFGGWFSSHKLQVETYIISFLENSSKAIVEKAAAAFLFLQQVGNAGNDGINHRKNFQDSLQKLCTTFHDLLDQFFENRVDISHIDNIERPNQEGFTFNNHSFDSGFMISVTAERIKNILIFITVMMKKGYPVCKDVRSMDILNVINRGTVPHHCLSTSTDNSKEDYQFCVNLNNIQVQLMHLLRVFIYCHYVQDRSVSFVISKILIDCLKKSQNCQCFDLDVYYQETIYLTLKCWINISRTALNSYFQEQLIACILKDISPLKNSVSLKIQAVTNKKGTVQKHKNEPILMSSRNRTLHDAVDKRGYTKEREEIRCRLALNALTTFFKSGFIQLEKKTIKNIYTVVFTVLNDINTSKIPHPYRNHKCQLNLFELLVAFYEQDTLKELPFVSLSINILNTFSSSSNTNMAAVCKRGLNILEKICQPISIPLNTSSLLITEGLQLNKDICEETNFMECITDITSKSLSTEDDHDSITSCKSNIIILDNREISSSLHCENGEQKSENGTINESYKNEVLNELIHINESENEPVTSSEYENERVTISGSVDEVINEPINISESGNEVVTISVSEDEPLVKRSRMITEDDEINLDLPKSETSASEFQDLNSFVDEVKEY